MNRADRLRKVAPGATDEAVSVLAGLPADQVAAIATFARQAQRDALDDAADRKRQRKADDRANANYDEESLTRRNVAVIASQGQRARRGSLDALEGLGRIRAELDAITRIGVDGCRAEGIPDAVIAEALGITRQAVGQRFGRKGAFTPDEQAG